MFLFESSKEKKLRENIQKHIETCLRNAQDSKLDKYKLSMEAISKQIQGKNQKAIEQVVDTIKTTIKDDEFQPVRKYQAIKLLRDLMKIQIKNKNNQLGKYVVKKILKRLTILAGHKAESSDENRGRDLFKNAKKGQQKYSIMFLNELLLAIEEWSKNWPGVSDGTRQQFHSAYKQLITNRVQFPKETIKAQQPKGYRNDDSMKSRPSSVSPYGSISQTRLEEKPYSSISEGASKIPKEELKGSSNKGTSKKISEKHQHEKIDQKQISEHFSSISEMLGVLTDTLRGSTAMNAEQCDMIKCIIQQLPSVIAKGDDFVAHASPQNAEDDFYIKKIQQTFQFSNSISKDIKKASKNIEQFPSFKKKYLILSNKLVASLREKPQKENAFKRPSLTVDTKSREKKARDNENYSPQMPESAIKRLSIPKVKGENAYNSSSGRPDWVIKEQNQFNSNSHQSETANEKQFGSFGISGIKGKPRNSVQNGANKMEDQLKQDKKQQFVESTFNRQSAPRFGKASESAQEQDSRKVTGQLGEYQLSSENKVFNKGNKKKQVFYFDDPSNQEKGKQDIKEKHQKTDDMFNDSSFKQADGSQLQGPKGQDDSNEQGIPDFFGEFDDNKQLENNQLGRMVNQRDQRRNQMNHKSYNKKTYAGQPNSDNPFDNNMQSLPNSESENYSGFQKGDSSVTIKNTKKIIDSQLSIPTKLKNKSSNFNPFETGAQSDSVRQRKQSVSSKSFGNENPYSVEVPFQRRHTNPFSDNASVMDKSQLSQKSVNPFEDPVNLSKISGKPKRITNPFDDADGKSQISNNSKSQTSEYKVNQSMAKSQVTNPFETTSQNLRKGKKSKNPFQDEDTISRKSKVLNPFDTSNAQFEPESQKNYQSASQKGSFRKGSKKQAYLSHAERQSVKDSFEIKKQVQQQSNRESWRLSGKQDSNSNGQVIFDQFQDIAPKNNFSKQLDASKKCVQDQSKQQESSFKNPFEDSSKHLSQISRNVQKQQKTIHYSQFGGSNDQSMNKSKQGGSINQKSLIFGDFQDIGNANVAKAQINNSNFDFQAFDNPPKHSIQDQPKVKNNQEKQQFSAFDLNNSEQDLEKSGFKQDNKSKNSAFSGFNLTIDNKSEIKDNSGVDWNDFDQQGKSLEQSRQKNVEVLKAQEQNINFSSQRSNQRDKIDKGQFKLKLKENEQLKYESPEFNNIQKEQDNFQPNKDHGGTKVFNDEPGQIKFEHFPPVSKRGLAWNPLGVLGKQPHHCFNASESDLRKKKKQMLYYKQIYQNQKQLFLQVKQRKAEKRRRYQAKITQLDQMLKQKESYRKILFNLKETNHFKEEDIFDLHQRIKKASAIRTEILEKQKQLFQKTKQMDPTGFLSARLKSPVNSHKNADRNQYRSNANKWQIFNRNIKMMRQKESNLVIAPSVSSQTKYSKVAYNSSSFNRA